MASIKMEIIETLKGEMVYVDLNDVLDILKHPQEKQRYTVVFNDGDVWHNVKIRKSVYNKFIKIKEKRGQKDECMYKV